MAHPRSPLPPSTRGVAGAAEGTLRAVPSLAKSNAPAALGGGVGHVHRAMGITSSSESSRPAGAGMAGLDGRRVAQRGWQGQPYGGRTAVPASVRHGQREPAAPPSCDPAGSRHETARSLHAEESKEDKPRSVCPKHWDCLATQTSRSLQPRAPRPELTARSLCPRPRRLRAARSRAGGWWRAWIAALGVAAAVSCSSSFSPQQARRSDASAQTQLRGSE